jgi:hypothetical protein
MTTLSSLFSTTLASDEVYGDSWNGVTSTAPSKNAIYDEMETKAVSGTNTDITSMTGLDDDGIPGAKIVAATTITEGVSERATDSETLIGTDTSRHITSANLKYVLDRLDSYGVSWDESQSTGGYTRTGRLLGQSTSQTLADTLLPIQAAMRRCVMNDSGVVQYYLDPTTSYNKVGQAAYISGQDDAGIANKVSDAVTVSGTDDVGTASKVSEVGLFSAAASEYVGKWVHNTTDDTYALITAKDSDNVLSINVDIMDITENFNIGPLSAPAAEYEGHYVKNTTDTTYAKITAKDSDTALSIDADIMANGENFEICTSVLDGTDGQVMVEIPAFYYRYAYSGTTHTWEISLHPLSGFSLHPAFIKNDEFVPYRYIGAYEGIGWDASVGAYIDCGTEYANNWSGTTIDTVNDKLGSVSGKASMMDETRAEFRSIAANRGTGWRQQDYDLVSAIQLLYLIEYADWNSQSMIGMGRTELSGGSWIKDSYIGVTGKSNADGNGTNSVAGNTNAAYMTYRGVENFFGNVWKWVDGFNINNNIPYVSNKDTDFADGTATNYTALGITLPNTNNYQKTLEQQSRGFLPASVGGASNTYITDYYYQSSGWRVAMLGGCADSGAYAGVACWSLSSSSTIDYVGIAARLCR